MTSPTPSPEPVNPAELLRLFPTRETKIARIRQVEKALAKMEADDSENDPVLIEAHIRLTRGYRMGCGVFFLCLMALCAKAYAEGLKWALWLVLAFATLAAIMLFRGWIYRPDPKMIEAAYQPHHGTAEYQRLVEEMDLLARALSQDLRAEDEVAGN